MAYRNMPSIKRSASSPSSSRLLHAATARRLPGLLPLATLLIGAFLLIGANLTKAGAQTLPTVNITAVKVDTNSVKVDFQPVPGAQDYRIYDVTNPSDVKYAGVWHLDADNLG